MCTTNALKLLEIADRTDIPVAKGVDAPLVMPYRGPVAFVHGTDGQGDVFLPPPDAQGATIDAAHFIIRSVMDSPGEITIVALGPLTNVAVAMLLEPALTKHLAGIVLMGGNAFCGGNASPPLRPTSSTIPKAADIVFGADCQIVMVGLDVTEQIVMSSTDLARIASFGNPRAKHLAAITPFYANFYRGPYWSRRHLRPRFVDHQLPAGTAALHLGRASRRASIAARASVVARPKPAARLSDRETEWAGPATGTHSHRCRQPRRGRTGVGAAPAMIQCSASDRPPRHRGGQRCPLTRKWNPCLKEIAALGEPPLHKLSVGDAREVAERMVKMAGDPIEVGPIR